MASVIYLSCIDDSAKGNLDFDTNTFRVLLVSSGYTPNKLTHTKRSDITNEVSGAGYTAGGITCTCTVTKSTANNEVTLTFSAVNWPTASFTARGAVYYRARGGASSADELVGYDDFGANVTSSGATFFLDASVLTLRNLT
jgi:hypothetical protein